MIKDMDGGRAHNGGGGQVEPTMVHCGLGDNEFYRQ